MTDANSTKNWTALGLHRRTSSGRELEPAGVRLRLATGGPWRAEGAILAGMPPPRQVKASAQDGVAQALRHDRRVGAS